MPSFTQCPRIVYTGQAVTLDTLASALIELGLIQPNERPLLAEYHDTCRDTHTVDYYRIAGRLLHDPCDDYHVLLPGLPASYATNGGPTATGRFFVVYSPARGGDFYVSVIVPA